MGFKLLIHACPVNCRINSSGCWIEVPFRSSRIWILTALLVERNLAQGKRDRQRSTVVESRT